MVCCIRKLNAKSKIRKLQNKAEYRSFKNYDKEAFLSDLRTIDWERATSTSRGDPNKMASNFYDLFCSVLDVHAPIKKRKRVWVRAPTPWITPSVKQLMRERDRVKGQAERDHTLWPEYKRLRNKVTSELRKSVEAYFRDMVDENCNDPKGMWKVVNKVLNKDHDSLSPLSVTYEGQSIDKSGEIAEAFNNHFVTIGPKLAEKIECEESDDPLKYIDNKGSSADAPRFAFQKVTPDSIKREIHRLKSAKSAGHDKIPVRLVKDAADVLCTPLASIFNVSFEKGIFPNIWKIAKVSPIFKSGQKTDLCNYRPISVLSVFSKLLERIVHDQVISFMKVNAHFTKSQHAFQKLHSTLTSLINVTDSWFSNVNRHEVNASVFLDLKKAFDTVDHDILLAKLSAYGVDGVPYHWFRSYLTDRQQYCHINGHRSSQKHVQCGIPQGSCLGPLLFILYVNDFERCLENCTPNMYADDTSVTCFAEDMEELCNDLQNELINISDWMRQNKMSLNTKKSEFMIIGHKRQLTRIQNPIRLDISGEELKRVHEVKYLGVSVDESLSWTAQYKKLKSKLKSGLSSIRKLKNILPQTKLDQVYRALLESHLRYCNEIWGSLSNTKLDHLQRLQNRARTLIESSRLKDGWRCTRLSVSSLIQYDRAIMIYKITNDLCPDSLKGRFSTRSQLSNYRLRNSLDIDVPRQNLEFSKRSFYYSAAKVWNEIPPNIRQSPTIYTFKKKLKDFLLNRQRFPKHDP